jgi:hypothetical protein
MTEVFLCFFLSCKANASLKLALFLIFVLFYVFFCVVLCIVCFVSFSVLSVCVCVCICVRVCICVLNYCHRVATQLQLNISYHILLLLC